MIDLFNCGHPKDDENSRKCGRGYRCRICERAYHRELWALGRVKRRPKKKDAACTGCNCAITANKSGMCRQCNFKRINTEPRFKVVRSESIKNTLRRNPEKLEQARANIAMARSLRGPVDPERMREIGAKGNASMSREKRRQAQVKRLATILSWCPPHLRANYLALTVRFRIKAAEARAMIEEQHELEMARWRRSIGVEVEAENAPIVAKTLTPLERAMAAAAWTFDVTEEEILSKVRERRFAVARYALAVVLQRAGLSTPSIAKSLNKNDHTSAIHWIKRGLWFEQHDPKFARRLATIQQAWDGDERIAA